MTTKVNRDNWSYLLYEVRDFTPACMQFVPGSAEANKGGDISATSERVRWSDAGGRIAEPFTMTAKYTVLCGAGTQASGGTWIKRAPAGNAELGNKNMGPTINVLRKGTSILFHQPTNPQVGQNITLNVDTTNIVDGSQIAFTADGQNIGSAAVTNGRASIPWTPSTPGSKAIRATFAQTSTHAGSNADRQVSVAQVNVNSSVSVDVPGTPTVGQSTRITANVSPAGAGGFVEFRANSAIIGEVPVGTDGTAAINWIPAGSVLTTIDVSYSGREGVNPSTGVATSFAVTAADPGDEATITTLDAIDTTPVGQAITLNATVSPINATGRVDFYDGQVLIGTASVVNGVATYQWTPGAEGSRTIRAEFTPSGDFLASQATTQAVITPSPVDEEPEPEPNVPTDPGMGSLGSLTGLSGS
ncbi:Ig-like domain-containing protein [Rhodococcus sp. IEGM 1408]|uniref:Ig-like domain-containing protein n=1 Tax=Rhodococcus sp. IEGM 1408 TaxID=3082220 RepID=UPI00295438BB|nr:Ig-like domain-containing protein [Rhodococcus sp. IEGM 1408]MDV8002468.1 Ig-like domain-containing protein [Rhodococcus sp. IEGM 1408]